MTLLRGEWEKLVGLSHPSDGYFLVGEFLSETRMKAYPKPLLDAFSQAIRAITIAIQQPIRYAGPDQYGVFAPPRRWKDIRATMALVACLPETRPDDLCVLIDRPGNRRPLTWERNQVEILMMEGQIFTCPWTGKKLSTASYDLDHLLPLSVYPINEI